MQEYKFEARGVVITAELKERKQGKAGCPKCAFTGSSLCADAPSDCTDADETYYKVTHIDEATP